MINALSTKVYEEIDGRFFGTRLLNSTKYFAKKHGPLAACGTSLFLVASTVTSIALSYFCMEGAIRSFIEANNHELPLINRLRPLGDAGGWFSIAIFSTLAIKSLIEALVREGEYVQLQKVCKKWIKDHQDIENSDYAQVYLQVNRLLDSFNSRLYFPKNMASRRLVALDLVPALAGAAKNAKQDIDLQLRKTYATISSTLDEKTGALQYFSKAYAGFKAVAHKGYVTQSMAMIFGLAMPIILFGNACISIIGEFGLGHDLYVNRTGLEDTGHFGEWPVNAIEALSVAFFLHFWYIISEGTLSITHKVYATAIQSLQTEPVQHNRVCAMANQELGEIAAVCHYLKYPHEYRFQKYDQISA